MGSNYTLNYNVDIVYCIDATASMQPILDTVKNNAINFYDDFKKTMNKKQKPIGKLRIRVVAFRDYYYDGDEAMLVTDFFEMPGQADDLKACLNSIVADGGGDDPEDGLEGLAYSMKSNWCKDSGKKRHVIVVYSDDATHDLGFGKSVPNYPQGMPRDFDELTRWWGNAANPGVMDNSAKRLLLFTPDKPSWNTIRETWNNCIHYESDAGNGLEEVDYEQILSAICNSI